MNKICEMTQQVCDITHLGVAAFGQASNLGLCVPGTYLFQVARIRDRQYPVMHATTLEFPF